MGQPTDDGSNSMIIKTVNEYDFVNEFRAYERENFTREALVALFEYLEDYSRDTGEDFELDVIGLCCDFTEYESFEEIKEEYSSTELDSLDDLREHTTVIEFNYGIVIQDF
jgi:hypothetical protein